MGWLLAVCSRHEQRTHSCTKPTPVGPYLSECGVEVQVGHSDFEHRKHTSSHFAVMITSANVSAQNACPGPHMFVIYSEALKRTLAKDLILYKILISLDS